VYKKVQKRQMWSYLHLTIGRVGITLGIINGGLGLHIARASDYHKRAYAIVAAIIWTLWMAVAIWSEIRRAKRDRQAMHAAVAKAHAGHERTSSHE
jgi:low temperature requirement protein LtrA